MEFLKNIKSWFKEIFGDDADDTRVEKLREKLETELKTFSAKALGGSDDHHITSNNTDIMDTSIPSGFTALFAEIDALKKALGEEKLAREQSLRALEEQQKKEKKRLVEEEIKKAVQEAKIPANNDEEIKFWQQMLERDFDNAKIVLSKIPPIVQKDAKNISIPSIPKDKTTHQDIVQGVTKIFQSHILNT